MPRPPAAFSPLTTTKLDVELLAQAGQQLAQDAPAGPADDVADEEDGRDAGHTGKLMARHTEEEAANPLDEWARTDRTPRRCARPRRRRRLGVEPVLVPRWVQMVLLPVAIAGAYLFLHAAGHVLLLFIIAGLIALLLNPFVALCSGAHPARARRWDRDGHRAGARWSGSASCWPTRSPTRSRASRTTSRATSTTPTPSSPTCRTGSTATGIDLEVKQEGETALQTIGERHHGRRRRRRELHPRRGPDPRRGQLRADPDHRPERSTC